MSKQNRSCCSCRNIIITLILAAAGLAAALYFGLIDREDIDNAIDSIRDRFQDILDSDPFSGFEGGGTNPNTTSEIAWPTDKNPKGLELEIVNALDDRWVSFFEKAVQDWENGDPDALILTTSTINPDSNCKAIEGKMKVCNGDYGETGWRGVNELTWDGQKKIVQSVAKMNEFYLTDASSNDEKQYTMCHEVGHGFGLMHTDENFMNAPLGDCMDYSSNIKPNLLPGLVNYQKLAVMYGEVEGRRQRRKHRHRHLRSEDVGDSNSDMGTKRLPDWVNEKFMEKKKSLSIGKQGRADVHSDSMVEDGYEDEDDDEWKLLHKSEYGEIHQVHLGEGYYGHIRVLLA